MLPQKPHPIAAQGKIALGAAAGAFLSGDGVGVGAAAGAFLSGDGAVVAVTADGAWLSSAAVAITAAAADSAAASRCAVAARAKHRGMAKLLMAAAAEDPATPLRGRALAHRWAPTSEYAHNNDKAND